MHFSPVFEAILEETRCLSVLICDGIHHIKCILILFLGNLLLYVIIISGLCCTTMWYPRHLTWHSVLNRIPGHCNRSQYTRFSFSSAKKISLYVANFFWNKRAC